MGLKVTGFQSKRRKTMVEQKPSFVKEWRRLLWRVFFSAIVRWCFSFIVLLFRISIFCCTVINFVLRLLPAISVFLSNGILDHCKVNANGINVEKLLFRLISSCKNVNKIRTRWTTTKKKNEKQIVQRIWNKHELVTKTKSSLSISNSKLGE